MKTALLFLFLIHNIYQIHTANRNGKTEETGSSSESETMETTKPPPPPNIGIKVNIEQHKYELERPAKSTTKKKAKKTKSRKKKPGKKQGKKILTDLQVTNKPLYLESEDINDLLKTYFGESLIENGRLKSDTEDEKVKRFLSEVKAGDQTELFGSNPHYKQNDKYYELSRRFVPQYPYTEVQQEDPLTPKLAPPEVVLAAAKKSALLEASKPINPTDEVIRKDILRTGDYWNSVWREDTNPSALLRNNEQKNNMQLGSVRARILPGSKLFDLVIKLKKKSPRLLYIINNKDGK